MIIDVFSLLPFFIAFSYKKKTFLLSSAAVALVLIEYYSALPFGVYAIALGVALMSTIAFLRIFDASSYISSVIAFSIGIFIYTVIITLSYAIAFDYLNREIFLRGAIFFMNYEIKGLFLGFSIIGLRYGVRQIKYAFVEEKIF